MLLKTIQALSLCLLCVGPLAAQTEDTQVTQKGELIWRDPTCFFFVLKVDEHYALFEFLGGPSPMVGHFFEGNLTGFGSRRIENTTEGKADHGVLGSLRPVEVADGEKDPEVLQEAQGVRGAGWMNPSNTTSLLARDAKFRRAGTQAAAAIVLYVQFASHALAEQGMVIWKNHECGHFIVQMKSGYGIFEWVDGPQPNDGDVLEGDFRSPGERLVDNTDRRSPDHDPSECVCAESQRHRRPDAGEVQGLSRLHSLRGPLVRRLTCRPAGFPKGAATRPRACFPGTS